MSLREVPPDAFVLTEQQRAEIYRATYRVSCLLEALKEITKNVDKIDTCILHELTVIADDTLWPTVELFCSPQTD